MVQTHGASILTQANYNTQPDDDDSRDEDVDVSDDWRDDEGSASNDDDSVVNRDNDGSQSGDRVLTAMITATLMAATESAGWCWWKVRPRQ